MAEPRLARVILPDGRHLDIIVQPKLMTSELMDLVRSYFNLKEIKYFGLAYKNFGELCNQWLTLDKYVLEHELHKSELLLLNLLIRFYVPCISCLHERTTIELFYAQARSHVASGDICCDSHTVFRLTALALQHQFNDHHSESTTRSHLKKFSLPVSTLKEHPSLTYCENEVIAEYKRLQGVSSGSALVRYMIIVQGLSSYGVHLYEVKDKVNIPWWLGFGLTGVAVFDFNDKTCPRKVYPWNTIEHMHFRDKKFSVQLYDAERSLSRRASVSSDLCQNWTTTCQARAVWEMSVSQHKFYLHAETEGRYRRRNLLEIVAQLNQAPIKHSLTGSRSAISLTSNHPSRQRLSTSGVNPLSEARRKGEQVQPFSRSRSWTVGHVASPSLEIFKDGNKLRSDFSTKIFEALAEKRDRLQAVLNSKLLQLQSLCVQESTITGVLPKERLLDDGVRLNPYWYNHQDGAKLVTLLPSRNQQAIGKTKPSGFRHVQHLLNDSIPVVASVAGGIRDQNFNLTNKQPNIFRNLSTSSLKSAETFGVRPAYSSGMSQPNDDNEVFEINSRPVAKEQNASGRTGKSSNSEAVYKLVQSSAQCYRILNPAHSNNNAARISSSNTMLSQLSETSDMLGSISSLRSSHNNNNNNNSNSNNNNNTISRSLSSVSSSKDNVSEIDCNSVWQVRDPSTALLTCSLNSVAHLSGAVQSDKLQNISTVHTGCNVNLAAQTSPSGEETGVKSSLEEVKTFSPIPSPTSSHSSDLSPGRIIHSSEYIPPQSIRSNTSVHHLRNHLSSTSFESGSSSQSDNVLVFDTATAEQYGSSEATIQRYDTHVEISKSFQMADFLKYSQRFKQNNSTADT